MTGGDRPAIQGDLDNLQPRLGAAWDVIGRGRTVVKGAYGIYHDRLFQFGFANLVDESRRSRCRARRAPCRSCSGSFRSTRTRGVFAIDPSMRNPYFHRTSLGVDQRVGRGTSVLAAYVGTFGRDLARIVDLNFGAGFPQARAARSALRRGHADQRFDVTLRRAAGAAAEQSEAGLANDAGLHLQPAGVHRLHSGHHRRQTADSNDPEESGGTPNAGFQTGPWSTSRSTPMQAVPTRTCRTRSRSAISSSCRSAAAAGGARRARRGRRGARRLVALRHPAGAIRRHRQHHVRPRRQRRRLHHRPAGSARRIARRSVRAVRPSDAVSRHADGGADAPGRRGRRHRSVRADPLQRAARARRLELRRLPAEAAPGRPRQAGDRAERVQTSARDSFRSAARSRSEGRPHDARAAKLCDRAPRGSNHDGVRCLRDAPGGRKSAARRPCRSVAHADAGRAGRHGRARVGRLAARPKRANRCVVSPTAAGRRRPGRCRLGRTSTRSSSTGSAWPIRRTGESRTAFRASAASSRCRIRPWRTCRPA